MPEFKEFPISELFSIVYGNGKLTKAYIHNNPGTFPVYGASSDPSKSAGFVDTFDFDTDALSFVRIGYAGSVALRKAPFSVTCNVQVLKPKPHVAQDMHLPYFVPVISAALRGIATGRFKEDGRQDYTQVSQKHALSATISVPVTEGGYISLADQKCLADRAQKLSGVKRALSGAIQRLEDIEFELSLGETPFAEKELQDIFDIKTGSAKYTEKFALLNAGPYPLYTASTRGGAPYSISNFDHDVEAIHYTTEGLHAGTVFHRPRHKFAMSGHAGILTRIDPAISYQYAFFEVTRVFNEQGFCWASNTASKGKIRTLSLRFPVKPDGNLDMEAQDRIALRMQGLLAKREQAVEKLKRLAGSEVVFESE